MQQHKKFSLKDCEVMLRHKYFKSVPVMVGQNKNWSAPSTGELRQYCRCEMGDVRQERCGKIQETGKQQQENGDGRQDLETETEGRR